MNGQNDRSALAAVIVAIASLVVVIAVLVGSVFFGGSAVPTTGGNIEARSIERGALLCATESGNCVESWNGSDLIMYSDAGSTQKYHVDGATGNVDAEGTLNVAGAATLGSVTLGASTLGDTTIGGTLIVTSTAGITGAVTMADNASVAGTLGVTGNSTFSADVAIADDLIISSQTAISVTDGGIITATGTYQQLESAGTVTATVAVLPVGTVLTLINTTATTINIVDTGTAKLSTAGALGQYDSLVLWSDGTNWIEVSRSNN